jgi:hypothetical protein
MRGVSAWNEDRAGAIAPSEVLMDLRARLQDRRLEQSEFAQRIRLLGEFPEQVPKQVPKQGCFSVYSGLA